MTPAAFLEARGARNLPHSGRTLFHHLLRTWQILAAWDVANHVCLAGLYHAVYGTRRLRIAIANTNDRRLVATMIGYKAERLAYLFSRIDPRLFFEDALPGSLENRSTCCGRNDPVAVRPSEVPELAIIECANLYEQCLSQPSNSSLLISCVSLCGRRKFERLVSRWELVGASGWMLNEARTVCFGDRPRREAFK